MTTHPPEASRFLRDASPSPSQSFAQTTAEFALDSSSSDGDADDDPDTVAAAAAQVRAREIGGEAYEMQETKQHRHGPDSGSGSDGDGEDGEKETPGDRRRGRRRTTRRESAGPSGLAENRRASEASTLDDLQLYTPDEEAAVVRKFDRRLVLFVAFLYMLSFVDRSNIGNARIAGMDADLQTTPPFAGWYEWTLTAFYVAYIAFEWMALLWRLVPAHVYASLLVLSWGITASLQSVTTSYPWLVVLRFLLGIGEAGFAGIPYYLSFFFRRDELAFRIAIFLSAAPLATSFASSLAWFVLRLARLTPIAPWRLLFLIEGFPSVIVSVVTWRLIPDSPQNATYLDRRERQVARLRLRHEHADDAYTAAGSSPSASPLPAPGHGLSARQVLLVLCDPVAWATAAMLFLANTAYASLPVFLPTILESMGHDAPTAQALSAPPYLVSFAVVLATALLSDRMRTRAVFVTLHALASFSGYAVLALSGPLGIPHWARYAAIYPAASGFFCVVALTLAWSVNNQAGASRRGGGFALMQVVGQLGPLLGTRLYPDSDAPYYTRGMAVCAAAMLLVAATAAGLGWGLARRNATMDREEAEQQQRGEEAEAEGLVGKRRRSRTRFRYIL